MSLITPDFGLLFWMVLIFGILFFILAKFGLPISTGMVDKRSDRINDSIRKAEEAEMKLSALAEKQSAMMDEARREQADIIKEASDTRDKIVAQAKQQAQQEADKIIAEARVKIETERENALRDLRSQVAALSVEVAEKVVRESLSDARSQTALLDRMIDEASSAELN